MNTRTLDRSAHPTPTGNGHLIEVTFEWSDEHGNCYDCGLPAAYFVWDDTGKVSWNSRLRCSVCAADAAANGHNIRNIDEYLESRGWV